MDVRHLGFGYGRRRGSRGLEQLLFDTFQLPKNLLACKEETIRCSE